jgi:hypothetical protein
MIYWRTSDVHQITASTVIGRRHDSRCRERLAIEARRYGNLARINQLRAIADSVAARLVYDLAGTAFSKNQKSP